MVSRYVSQDSVEDTAEYFLNQEFEEGAHLTYFLIFKYMGAGKRPVPQDEETKRKSREATFYLMSLYGSDEEAPERDQIQYPFNLDQTLTVSLKRFANSDMFNNVRNNPGRYQGILEYNSDREEYSIIFNYLDNLINHCGLDDQKIDFRRFAAWVMRDKEFDIEKGMSDRRFTRGVVSAAKETFNISDEEERRLFHRNGPLITHSSKKADMGKIREILGFESEDDKEVNLKSPELGEDLKEKSFSLEGENPTRSQVQTALNEKGQVVMYGPPGTSKTYTAREIAENYDNVKLLQLHQSYGYEEFIGGTKVEDGEFEQKKGAFTKFIEKASENSDQDYLLVLDEINRGNISKIFGELITLLDRDGYEVETSFDADVSLTIPDNLHIIGTMNTADRSIAFVDYALRRRFRFLRFNPDTELLTKVTDDTDQSLEGIDLVQLFKSINAEITETLDQELQLGHTYFMPNHLYDETDEVYSWTAEDLRKIFNQTILPVIEEYTSGDRHALESILTPHLAEGINETDEFANAVRDYLQ
jgi:5-methylcytosine-specific restriction protein B